MVLNSVSQRTQPANTDLLLHCFISEICGQLSFDSKTNAFISLALRVGVNGRLLRKIDPGDAWTHALVCGADGLPIGPGRLNCAKIKPNSARRQGARKSSARVSVVPVVFLKRVRFAGGDGS
jgi:hypothetical protein